MSESEEAGEKHGQPRIHPEKRKHVFPVTEYQLESNPENLFVLYEIISRRKNNVVGL